jgi:hypothetical protein
MSAPSVPAASECPGPPGDDAAGGAETTPLSGRILIGESAWRESESARGAQREPSPDSVTWILLGLPLCALGT